MDLQTAAILNEAKFSEFVEEETDARSCCPYHFRQRLLNYPYRFWRPVPLVSMPVGRRTRPGIAVLGVSLTVTGGIDFGGVFGLFYRADS